MCSISMLYLSLHNCTPSGEIISPHSCSIHNEYSGKAHKECEYTTAVQCKQIVQKLIFLDPS